MELPDHLRYTKTHEWVLVEDDIATVGITEFAQHQLSDITYVELPDVGSELAAEDDAAVVESVKAASDVYAPLSGTIDEVNVTLAENPEQINTSPFEDGWLFKLKIKDPGELDKLLTPEAYRELMPADE